MLDEVCRRRKDAVRRARSIERVQGGVRRLGQGKRGLVHRPRKEPPVYTCAVRRLRRTGLRGHGAFGYPTSLLETGIPSRIGLPTLTVKTPHLSGVICLPLRATVGAVVSQREGPLPSHTSNRPTQPRSLGRSCRGSAEPRLERHRHTRGAASSPQCRLPSLQACEEWRGFVIPTAAGHSATPECCWTLTIAMHVLDGLKSPPFRYLRYFRFVP